MARRSATPCFICRIATRWTMLRWPSCGVTWPKAHALGGRADGVERRIQQREAGDARRPARRLWRQSGRHRGHTRQVCSTPRDSWSGEAIRLRLALQGAEVLEQAATIFPVLRDIDMARARHFCLARCSAGDTISIPNRKWAIGLPSRPLPQADDGRLGHNEGTAGSSAVCNAPTVWRPF